MSVPHLLDHIIIAGPDLAETVEWFRENEWWWKPQKEATEAKYAKLGR